MKTLEIVCTDKITFKKNIKVVDSPDEDGSKCIQIGGRFYQPFIKLMVFDPDAKSIVGLGDGAWVELDGNAEEKLLDTEKIQYSDFELRIIEE